MKDTIFEDYILIKERIEFHCDKIIELIRLHNDLIFKTKKGEKLKKDIINNSQDVKDLLIRNIDNFHLKDVKYEKFKELSKTYVFVHHLDKNPDDLPEDGETVVLIYKLKNCDFIYQEVATYNKEKNLFYIDDITYVDPDAKLLAWHKTIKYKEVCKK